MWPIGFDRTFPSYKRHRTACSSAHLSFGLLVGWWGTAARALLRLWAQAGLQN
jgi:hypothetical protein